MDFIGNKKVVSFLGRCLTRGTLSHAYLFSGPENVGKYSLAKLFAESVILNLQKLELSGEKNPTAQLDILLVAPEIEEKKGIIKKRAIGAEKIRDIQVELSLFPYHGAYKVLIIDDAHMMTNAAQNTLLKTLEEPNQTSMLILITHEESRILPTIISRSQKITYALASETEMADGFGKKVEAEKELLFLSMGRPGLLNKLLENPDQAMMYKEAPGQQKIATSGSMNERLRLAEEFSKNVVHAIEKMSLWMWILKKHAKGLTDSEAARTYGMIEKIDESITVLKTTNASAKLVLENLFISL